METLSTSENNYSTYINTDNPQNAAEWKNMSRKIVHYMMALKI